MASLALGRYHTTPPTISNAETEELQLDVNGNLKIVEKSSTVQSLGTDATGADTYATIKTPSANASRMEVYNAGTNDAIISLDAGVTDHFVAPGGGYSIKDNVTITSGVAIQAKNRVAGQNYTDLYVSIW